MPPALFRSRPGRFVLALAVLGLLLANAASAQERHRVRLGFGDQPPAQEEIAILWQTPGGIQCAWTKPEPLAFGFQFDDFNRWSATTSDGSGLGQGDPTTITWSIVPDGTSIPGFIGEPSSPSDLIAMLDAIVGAGPGGADLTQRPWFPILEQGIEVWSSVSGLSYAYEPADDGVQLGSSSGQVGVRGDVRIGGHSIDGQSGSNTLAYNFFPNNGDMVIDTDNTSFYGNSSNNYRGFRNTLAHEHGHGLGIDHSCPIDQTKLMEPFLSTQFDGPQEDDVLAGNRGYGDPDEFPVENDQAADATSMGALGAAAVSQASIDDNFDGDFFSFSAPDGASATVTLTPTGTTYLEGPQNLNGSCTPGTSFNALTRNDLALELRDQTGVNPLAVADFNGTGVGESLVDVPLSGGAGTYFVLVEGDASGDVQMYDLTVSVTVANQADLALAASDSVDPAVENASLRYDFVATNNGPATANDVSVQVTLPAGVTLLSTDGCAEDPSAVPTCTLGTIASGGSTPFSVTVRVGAGAASSITGSGAVSASIPDPVSGNDTGSEATTVVTPASCTPSLVLGSSDTSSGSAFVAETTITAGNGYAVLGAETVRFVAGTSIALQSGFSVAAGGQFEARVDPFASCSP